MFLPFSSATMYEVHNKYLRYNKVVSGKHLAHTNSVQDSLNSSLLEDIRGLGVQKVKGLVKSSGPFKEPTAILT